MLTGHRCFVHLSNDEYSGSTRVNGEWKSLDENGKPIDNMWSAAKEVFDANPTLPYLVVTVYEHGGWHLSYLRDKTIVGTANDRAVMTDAAKRFYEFERREGVKWEYLPEVWRGRDAA